jgi:hypothetical protein
MGQRFQEVRPSLGSRFISALWEVLRVYLGVGWELELMRGG